METSFRQLIALKDDNSPYKDDLRSNRLEEVLIRAREYSAARDRPLGDKRIQSACDYMQTHLAEGFSVDDIAAACHLSTSRLAHIFKEQMGVSPKSWGNNMRLQQARKLLLANNDSINHIARQVGYEDPSQFTKYFKRNMGCSPREFRQSLRAR
jgi:AraC family transcriptional regulator of arabinose operon